MIKSLRSFKGRLIRKRGLSNSPYNLCRKRINRLIRAIRILRRMWIFLIMTSILINFDHYHLEMLLFMWTFIIYYLLSLIIGVMKFYFNKIMEYLTFVVLTFVYMQNYHFGSHFSKILNHLSFKKVLKFLKLLNHLTHVIVFHLLIALYLLILLNA